MRIHFDAAGLLLGGVFFALSLFPSLLPRPPLMQGLLSGLTFAAGYAVAVAAFALWRYLQLPMLAGFPLRVAHRIAGVLCVLAIGAGLWHAAYWQGSLCELMGVEEWSGTQPLLIVTISTLTFCCVLAFTRLFRWVARLLTRWLDNHAPPRLSRVLAIGGSVLLFWTAIDGVLFSALLRVADRSFQRVDALFDPELPRPTNAGQTGSAESLVSWEDLGRQGRLFVAGGPDADKLGRFFGRATPMPIRVYVGLNSAESPEARARLALAELIRVGGFERSVLLLVTPTGTGWVDPAGQDPVEYLHRGDIATVAAQYSYLNSPLALMTEAAYGAEMARALFQQIYGHWRTLPQETRPKLYLSGLSLGSLNSDLSFDFYDIIDAPFHGALWSGPPFRHGTWQRVTAGRDPDSPYWLPVFRDGAVVRFKNQWGGLGAGGAEWGRFRIVFLQYASDPITFFSPNTAWRAPEWLGEPRAPDVSPSFRWFPVVTMLQLAVDMVLGTAPTGFGHEIAAVDYLDAWLALTEPAGWSDEELARLRALFASRDAK